MINEGCHGESNYLKRVAAFARVHDYPVPCRSHCTASYSSFYGLVPLETDQKRTMRNLFYVKMRAESEVRRHMKSYRHAASTLLVPRGGELRTQKLKSQLVRTQSLNVLPLKPGVGQYIAIHATLTARDFFLAYFYPSGPFTCIFSNTSPDFSRVGCG